MFKLLKRINKKMYALILGCVILKVVDSVSYSNIVTLKFKGKVDK